MNFFSKLFGPRNPEPKPPGPRQEINLSSSLEWIDSRANETYAEFVSASAKKFSEVRSLIQEARVCLKEIENVSLDSDETGNPRLRKIVETSKLTFISRMNSLLRRITPPDSEDFNSVRKYCLEAFPELQSEINAMGKNIAYTGILLKSELKKFAEIMKALDSLLSGLHNDLHKNAGLQSVLRARAALSELVSIERELLELEKTKIPAAQKSLGLSASGLESLKSRLSELSGSKEIQEHNSAISELGLLREEKSLLKQRFLRSISHVDKALKRMGQQSESKKFILPAEKALLLKYYLEDPFNALGSDQQANGLKELLSELRGAIEKNIVEFKPEEKQKRLDSISIILDSSLLEKIFSERALLENKISEAEKNISHSSSQGELDSVKRRIAEMERSFAEEKIALGHLEGLARSKRAEFLPKKAEAEKILREFCGSGVSIISELEN